ncbi:hypothetical protein FHT21_002750 [Pedobacter sp. SG908]|nr:hypothetical protein [Pedobacter sp. SG908]
MLSKGIHIMALFFCILCLMNLGCAQTNIRLSDERDYEEYKRGFDQKFTAHFPVKISASSQSCAMFSDKNEKKNDFILMLCENGISQNEINHVLDKNKDKVVAEYKASDSCLLIVNRFETKETLDNPDLRVKIDSSLIHRECYQKKYPVPNFVNYGGSLHDSFMIYVLESEKINSWERKFGMGPAPQMPDPWKNGFSRGIAISKEKKTVIYWTVIW